MIKFNELRVSSCNKKLMVDVSVLGLNYYTDVYIDRVVIDTQDTFVGNTGPSNTPIFTYTVPEEAPEVIIEDIPGATYTVDYGNIKNLRLELTELQLSSKPVDTTLFFVFVYTRGIPAQDTPCGMDNSFTLAAVGDILPIYQVGLNWLKELNNTCSPPIGLTDYILKINALNIAFKTCNYTLAIKYWKKFFGTSITNASLTNQCGGCNG